MRGRVDAAIDSPVRFALLSPQIPELVANTNPPIRQDAQNTGILVVDTRRFLSQPTQSWELLSFSTRRARLCIGIARTDLVPRKFLPAAALIGSACSTSTASPRCGGKLIH